ncbi:xanthine dehydrogenase family protein molybdopterin-binding subunit [Actinophytocola sediminis]
MSKVQNAAIATIRAVLGRVPARWLPGGSPDPLIEQRVLTGRPTRRVDGLLKAAGEAVFATDVALDRLSYATLVHSTVTRGRISRIDTAAAEAAPGVLLALTYRNMPRLGIPAMLGGVNMSAAGNSGLPIMQDPEVRYNGQVVAVVVAQTQEQADHAASLVEVDYTEQTARVRFEDAKTDARSLDSLLLDRNPQSVGDAERELGRSAHRVDNLYRTPPLNHNAIELHGVTVAWEQGTLVVHDANQAVATTARALAGLFDLKPEQVRVRSPFVGGAFGAKAMWDHHIIAAAAARIVDRPVRLMLSREGVYRIIGGRSPAEQRVAIGADAEGNLTALVHTGYSVMPPYAACPEQFASGSRLAYRAGSYRFHQRHLDLDIVPNTFMRAPGEAIGSFALESAVDELAGELGVDPIELRLRNTPHRHPITGQEFSQHAGSQAWRDGAERFGWADRPRAPGERRDGEWAVGMGCAGGGFPYVRLPAKVGLTLRGDGSATVFSSAQDMGMGVATVQAQQAADRLGLPLHQVSVEFGDSALPKGPMAGGSAQTTSNAAAITAAARKLTGELLRLVGKDSPVSGLRASEVRLTEEGVASVADPGRHEKFSSILAGAGRDEVSVTASSAPPLEFLRFTMHSSSAIFCEVRVSTVTGEVRVSRLLGSFDTGTIVNPATATSQFKGGMIMGLGLALTEETLFDDRSGRIMNPSLADYHVPAHLDVPEIEVMWTGIPDPRAPLGARGIGEIGVTGVAAAVANAVFNATGTRVRDLPITLDKLLG